MKIFEIRKKLFTELDFKIIYPPSSNGYYDELLKNIDDFEKTIKEIAKIAKNIITEELKNNINLMNKSIKTSLDLYLSGKAGEAYKSLDNVLKKINSSLELMTTELDKKYSNNNNSLYRVRVSERAIETKGELFHIPFPKRHLVGTQRYSISGVPSLYLGNSLYCCWLELNKPLLSNMHISAFKIKRNIKVLDFTYLKDGKYDLIDDWLDKDDSKNDIEKFKAFLTIYPLIVACSFKKDNEHKAFIIEYIIPNLLLQWITTNKFDISGLMYYSTKIEISDYSINFVIPPKNFKNKNELFCRDLVNTFTLSEPISWQEIEIMQNPILENIKNDCIRPNLGIIGNYKSTKFFQAERFLDSFKQDSISEDKNIKALITQVFNKNLKGKVFNKNEDNKVKAFDEGHWIEKQLGISSNNNDETILYGFELRSSLPEKLTFGDWRADYYIFNDEKFDISRNEFLRIFGTYNIKKDRYAWTGFYNLKPGMYNEFGQKIEVDTYGNIFIEYNYNQDKRKVNQIAEKFKLQSIKIAQWDSESIRNKIEDKFNQLGWIFFEKNEIGEYSNITFAQPINFDYWIIELKKGNVFFDSGMYEGNVRYYSLWRAKKKFFDNILEKN